MTAVKGCRLLIAKPYPGSRIRCGGGRAEVEVRWRREVVSGGLGVCNAWMPVLPRRFAERRDEVSGRELSGVAGPEHEASTSAAPALEMTLLVGPNSNLPAFKDRRDNLYLLPNR